MVAGLAAAGDVDGEQVVKYVVAVGSGIEHRAGRGGLREAVQAVVAHGAGLLAAGGVVGDGGHVAVAVIGVLQVQAPVGQGAAAGGGAVGASLRQAAGILGQGVDDAVAVGELLDGTVGVVAHRGSVSPRLGRLAERVGAVAHRQARGVAQRRKMGVAVVAVADGPGGGRSPPDALAGQQPAPVVAVGVGDQRTTGGVVGGDGGGQRRLAS